MTKYCALYARVSTQQQAQEGTSLDTQLAACRVYAQSHDMLPVLEIQEDASGATLERAGLDRIREEGRRGSFSVLVVYDTDRLSRDLTDMLIVVRELERAGVAVEFVQAPRESSPAGELFFNIKTVFGAYERKLIQERTRRGKRRAVEQGRVILSSRTAYGYRAIYGTGKLEVDEVEAEWVRAMFRWVVEEHATLGEVARRLQSYGVPRTRGGKCWYPGTIHRILTNSIYKGLWSWNKHKPILTPENKRRAFTSTAGHTIRRRPRDEWLFVEVTPIVSEEQWNAAQEVFARNKHDAQKRSKRYNLLRGMLFCQVCGARLHGEHSNTSNYHYSCRVRPRNGRPPCRTGYWNAPRLEDAVWAEVCHQLLRPGMKARVERAVEEGRSSRAKSISDTGGTTQQQKSLDKRQDALTRQKQKLLRLMLRDDTPFDTTLLQQEEAGLATQQAAIDRERIALQTVEDEQKNVASQQARFHAAGMSLEGRLESATSQERRALLETIGFRAVVAKSHIRLFGLPEDTLIDFDDISGNGSMRYGHKA